VAGPYVCLYYLETHTLLYLILTTLFVKKFPIIFKDLTPKMEQKKIHTIMLYEVKLGHNVTETSHNINEAWGKRTTTERTVRRWFQRFQNGDVSLEEATGRGRLASVENNLLRTIVESNPRKTV
jgi:HTH domain in Mos1 transposase